LHRYCCSRSVRGSVIAPLLASMIAAHRERSSLAAGSRSCPSHTTAPRFGVRGRRDGLGLAVPLSARRLVHFDRSRLSLLRLWKV
jgi:hypothetical protein